MKKYKKPLYSITFLIAALFAWIVWGNQAIQTTTYEVKSPKIAAGLSGFTIVQVSDYHNEQFGDRQQRLISKIEAIGPDLIAVTGDLIDARHTNTAAALEVIEAAVKIAPVYFVTGNHEAWYSEYEGLKQQLIQAGVYVLDGQVEEVAYRGEQITLLGIEDPSFSERSAYIGDQEIVHENIKELSYDQAGYAILLSHRPEVFSVYVTQGVNLVLTGHAHGGQFRIPFVGGLVAPDQGLFPPYTSGVFKENDTQMVVSRGLGNSIIPFRINNRPELVVVRLFSTSASSGIKR